MKTLGQLFVSQPQLGEADPQKLQELADQEALRALKAMPEVMTEAQVAIGQLDRAVLAVRGARSNVYEQGPHHG